MKCKYCGEEMAGRGHFCPICGKDNRIEPETAQMVADVDRYLQTEGEAVVIVPQPDGADEPAAQEALRGSPQLKKAKRFAVLSGFVAALAVLATVLFFGIRSGWDVGSWFSWLLPRENTVMYRNSYTVSDRKAYRKKDEVVATMGDAKLTNGQLQMYYWTGVYDFLSNYSYYLTAFDLDLNEPFDEQKLDANNSTLKYLMSRVEEDMTWQHYFLNSALQMWQSNQAFCAMAEENGFTLDANYRQTLDAMPGELEAEAKKEGFDSVDAYIQESMGAGCTLADYMAYMETYYLGYAYFASLYEAIDPTEAELEAYFAEHEAEFKQSGITKDMGYTVDVRHILISIDTIAKAEGVDSKEDYTQQHWDLCQAEAQKVLDLFLEGDLSEESFGELAKKYSEDAEENVDAGGLYTYVRKGEMEDSFDEWCFAEGRKTGDYGLVKTSYGYHIIYFVDSEAIWLTQTRAAYLQAESQKIVDSALDSHGIQVDYKKIVLGEVPMV